MCVRERERVIERTERERDTLYTRCQRSALQLLPGPQAHFCYEEIL